MRKGVLRNIRILKSRIANLSFRETLDLFKAALFKRDRIVIYCKELNANATLSSFPGLDNLIGKGNPGEIEQARQHAQPLPWEFCCDLYDGVKDFFICKKNGTIGHISWIYHDNDPNRIIKLRDDEAEIKFSMTLPAFRGQGIYPATLIKIQQYLKEQGYKRVFICAKDDNIRSIKGIEKAGFSVVATINLVKVAGIQLNKRYAASH